MNRYNQHYAFICGDTKSGEWSVIKVAAPAEEDAWCYAAVEAGKLGYNEEAKINFLGFVV